MTELETAIDKLRLAIENEGLQPRHHRRVMEAHRKEWPTLWAAIDRLLKIHERGIRTRIDASVHPAALCPVPPPGWWCSREPGHDGPCAARPTEDRMREAVERLRRAEEPDAVLETDLHIVSRDALPIGGPPVICTQCGLRARSPIIKELGKRHDDVPYGECVNKAACGKRQRRTKQELDKGEYVHE